MLGKIKVRLFIVIVATIILQTTCVPYFSINYIKPDLCTALYISLLLRFPHLEAVLLAFFIGLVKELFSNHFFGLEIISLAIPALVFPVIIRKADIENHMVKFCIVFLFSLTSFFIYLSSIIVAEHVYHARTLLFSRMLGASLYTTIVALGVDWIVKKYIPRKTKQYELF